MQQRTPKIEIRDSEIWVCLGHGPVNRPFAVLTDDDLARIKDEIRTNEHKRMAYILEHIVEFQDWLQWRGNDKTAGAFLDVTFPWAHEGKTNAKPKRPSE